MEMCALRCEDPFLMARLQSPQHFVTILYAPPPCPALFPAIPPIPPVSPTHVHSTLCVHGCQQQVRVWGPGK